MSFPVPRPRGVDMPSAKPLRKTTNTSSNSSFGSVKAMDCKGRFTVCVVPPPHFGLVGAVCTADAQISAGGQ